MHKSNRFWRFWRAVHAELREHKSSFAAYTLLRLSVLLVLFLQLHNRNYESVFLCILTLLLLIVPSIVQVTFRVELPSKLEVVILLFVYAAEFLGEIQKFYVEFPFWDLLMHTINGFLAAAIGFSLVNLLNHSPNLAFKLSPFFTVMVAFCVSMTVGVVWEFFEFAMDQLFCFDMQKDTVIHTISSVALNPANNNLPLVLRDITEVTVNGQKLSVDGYLDIGLIDTMEDLFVNFIGALIFSFFGYRYAANHDENALFQQLIPTQKSPENDYLAQQADEESKAPDAETDSKTLAASPAGLK